MRNPIYILNIAQPHLAPHNKVLWGNMRLDKARGVCLAIWTDSGCWPLHPRHMCAHRWLLMGENWSVTADSFYERFLGFSRCYLRENNTILHQEKNPVNLVQRMREIQHFLTTYWPSLWSKRDLWKFEIFFPSIFWLAARWIPPSARWAYGIPPLADVGCQ